MNVNRIIRSKRRTIALIVERDGSVTVRAPLKISACEIEEFVEKHVAWVKRKQKEMEATVPEPPRQYRTGESFPFLGRNYPLEVVKGNDKDLILKDTFQLAESEQENAEEHFRNWYRKQAREIIEARVAHFAEKYQVKMGKIRITSARTRWGSCSSKGFLSFSWRLVMNPQEVIDYVVIHELAHTVHHNHSKRFWRLVESWMPDFRERRKQLQKYGDGHLLSN